MSSKRSDFSNADQALIHEFVEGGMRPMAMDSNPLACALQCRLLHIDLALGTVEIEFQPDPLFIQGTGVLQGGSVSAMLDFAMAFAALASVPIGTSCATANIDVSYVLPAPQGRYRAFGRIDRRGRSVAFAQARIERCDTEIVVATASSTLMLFVPSSIVADDGVTQEAS